MSRALNSKPTPTNSHQLQSSSISLSPSRLFNASPARPLQTLKHERFPLSILPRATYPSRYVSSSPPTPNLCAYACGVQGPSPVPPPICLSICRTLEYNLSPSRRAVQTKEIPKLHGRVPQIHFARGLAQLSDRRTCIPLLLISSSPFSPPILSSRTYYLLFRPPLVIHSRAHYPGILPYVPSNLPSLPLLRWRTSPSLGNFTLVHLHAASNSTPPISLQYRAPDFDFRTKRATRHFPTRHFGVPHIVYPPDLHTPVDPQRYTEIRQASIKSRPQPTSTRNPEKKSSGPLAADSRAHAAIDITSLTLCTGVCFPHPRLRPIFIAVPIAPSPALCLSPFTFPFHSPLAYFLNTGFSKNVGAPHTAFNKVCGTPSEVRRPTR